MNFLIGTFALAINVLLWIWILSLYDRTTPDPPFRIFKVTFLGGVLSVLVMILVMNRIFNAFGFAGVNEISTWWKVILKFLAGAIFEELSKTFIFVMLIKKLKVVKEPIDCMIYAMAVALGFSALENSGAMFVEGIPSIIIRSVISMPNHIAYGALIGYGYARAVYLDDRFNVAHGATLWDGVYLSPAFNNWSNNLLHFFDLLFHSRQFVFYLTAAILVHASNNIVIYYRDVVPILHLFMVIYLLVMLGFIHSRLRYLHRQSPIIALKKCPNCSAPIGPFYDTCKVCGAILEREFYRFCQQCGKQVLKADDVCGNCGAMRE